MAALETRERKEAVDLPRLREEWCARGAELGFGRRKLEALLGRCAGREPALEAVAARLLGPDGADGETDNLQRA